MPPPKPPRRVARLVEATVAHRESTIGDEPQTLLYASQALILCGLPYRPTDERSMVREARLGSWKVRVRYSATGDDKLPYGKDRVLLLYLIDRSYRSNNPTVTLDCATEYLDEWASNDGRSYARFAASWRRLANLVINIERNGQSGTNRVLVSEYHLPTRSAIRSAREGALSLPLAELATDYSITFDASFWNDLKIHHIPLNRHVVRAFAERPRALDFVNFVHWRSHLCLQAKTKYRRDGIVRIPWRDLRDMLGSADQNPKRLRTALKETLAELRELWPGCNAQFEHTASAAFLVVGPPTDGGLVNSRETEGHRRNMAHLRGLFENRQERLLSDEPEN